MVFQNIIELERNKTKRPPSPPECKDGFATLSPFEHNGWVDSGPYYVLNIHVRMLDSIDVSIDPEKSQLLLNAVINNTLFSKPAKNVKYTIPIPDDDNIDISSLITNVDNDDITVKLYKVHYEPSPLPRAENKKKSRCTIQ